MCFPNKILFVGKKQAGKTTAAKALEIEILDQASNDIWIDVDIFSFANELKNFCIENEWITREQAYGNNEQKNSLSKLKRPFELYYYDNITEQPPMTAREVLQYIGTDVFRRIDEDIWIRKCFKTIEDSFCNLAIIDDGRFENEVKRIKEGGGLTIFLERDIYKDNHCSESNIDKIDKNNFDYIVSNQNHSPQELKNEIKEIAKDILDKWIP